MKIFQSLLLSVLFSYSVSAQTITGSVSDSKTGEYLPSATILVDGTYRGTITNNEGIFSLPVDEFPVRLIVRYIGYEINTVTLNEEPDEKLRIELSRSVTEMDEIVVTEKDPGLSIMELVIERKKIWRSDLKTFKADAFTRQVLENDTTIVSISESGTRTFWDSEKGHREVQLYKNQTSNITANENFAGVSYMPNFYDDDIVISGFKLPGITHPNAMRFYHFRLLETLQMDGNPVYKIEVTPRGRLQPAFKGIAYVLGREYALLEVDLRPNDVVRFPPPVQEFDLSYKQQYSNYGGNYWLPVDMRVEGVIRISMIGLRFPAMKFRQTSRISEYKVNVELPDSLYRDSRRIVLSMSESDSVTAPTIEPIPMTSEEELAFSTIDSTQTLEKAFKPKGFLARMLEDDDRERSSSNLFGFIPDGFGAELGMNRVDGFKTGLKYEKSYHDFGFSGKISAGYSFNISEWNFGTKITQRLTTKGVRPQVSVLASYYRVTDPRMNTGLYSQSINSFGFLLGREDYFDYFRNEKIYSGIEVSKILPRIDIAAGFSHENHTNVTPDELYDYSLFNLHEDRRPNPEIFEGRLNSAVFEIGFNRQSKDFGFSGSRQAVINFEYSDQLIGSDFNYTNLTVGLDWNWETFYQRRLFSNTFDIHFSGGYAFGDLPPQRFGAIDGSLNRFTPFGTLKTRNNLPYEGDKFWVFTAEHNFRSLPFEIVGLNWFAKKGWGFILFGGAGYTEVNQSDLTFLPMVSDGIHTEAGISLNSILGIIRLDFAKRLDSPGSFIGFSVPRYF